MNRPRNPRRAYDEQGQEITPPTLGEHKRQGYNTLQAACDDCQRLAVFDATPFPDDLPIPDAALKLICSACGLKRITVGLNMAEYYEMLRQTTRWQGP